MRVRAGLPGRLGLVGFVIGITGAVTACTTAPSTSSPGTSRSAQPTSLAATWERVTLPAGLVPVTVVGSDSSVIVGAIGPGRPRPHLLVGADAASLTEIPLTPKSPYAFEARWFQVATHDSEIVAVAGARGGAHGNYRWTTWTGTTAGVGEQEQPFGVFGSYGAGDLVGIAYAGRSPVVLGAWQSESTGQDIATWTRSGDRWTRRSSTGTPLASTPTELVGATAITSRGDGLLLAGSVTHLEAGSVTVTPAVWVSTGAAGPWTRHDLPRTGNHGTSEVQAGRCVGDQCLLTGTTDGHLSVWHTTGDDIGGELPGIPKVVLRENAAPLAPLGPAGSETVVAPAKDGATVLTRDGRAWRQAPGPSGTPVSAVLHDGELWMVTTDDKSTGTLWRARVA